MREVPASAASLEALVHVLSDPCGNTPLHVACQAGRADAVAILLKAGAVADATDCRGDTPLHLAAAESHAACLDHIVQLAGVFTLRNALSAQVGRFTCFYY